MISIKNNSKFFVLLLLIVLLSTFSFFIPYRQALVLQPLDQNDLFLFVPAETGDTFKIKYLHSIHLTNVIESYRLTAQRQIRQYELEYEDFAIGMPSEASEGEVFEMKDGKYFLKNMNREFGSFVLRVGKVRANHTLVYKNKHYPLSEVVEPGTRLKIQVEKLSIIQQMEGVNILDEK
ncbi:RocC [Mesobacillus campisalis]|uniref:RocC n=1 Tax=Mesobacillus campisalis TaxID=1408103 RepID=A0A0M2STH4_9BACI|nr:DUF1850 domain-containing protein [Mesobacillus campisalis]KKK37006.1 RocC [Mesobacillus campisalis]